MNIALKNRHIWVVFLLTVIAGFSYYGDQLGLPDWFPLADNFFSRNYVHDIHRTLFLIPMLYAAFVFRFRGALIVSVVAFCIIVPRGVFISPNPDPLLRSMTFISIATLATVLLGMERGKGLELVREVQTRRGAEEALRLSETRYRELFENMSSGVVVYGAIEGGADFIIKEFNQTAQSISRVKKSEVIGMRVTEVFPDIASTGLLDVLQKVWRTGEIEYLPQSFYRDNRISLWMENWVYRLPAGEVVTVFDDVTAHKQVDDDLKRSEARYRAIFDNASDAIYVRDSEGNIMMANRAMTDLTGYRSDQLPGMNIARLFPAESFEGIMKRQGKLIRDRDKFTSDRYELPLLRKDGTERLVEIVTSISGHRDAPVDFQAMMRDVTEQRRSQENMRFYTREITRAQEEERKRIARELHDDTAQELVSLGLDIDFILRSEKGLAEDVVGKLEDLHKKTNDILKGVRRFSQDLRPQILDALGLLDTLQWLADDMVQKDAVNASFQLRGDPHRLSPEAELLLFRIGQEALNNIRKHAGATEVVMELNFRPDVVTLTVSDNGRGFELPDAIGNLARKGKLGLLGMRERARLLGDEIEITSSPGKGTVISVEVNDS